MSVRMVTRFYNSATIRVPLFLSSRFLSPRCNSYWSNLLPTRGISRSICHCSSSVLQSLSRHTENNSRCATDATLDSVVKIFTFCGKATLVEPIKPSGPEDVKTMGFTQTKPRASSATRQTSSTVTTSVKEKGKAAKGTEPSPPKMQLSNRYDALKDKDD
ncbi:unnamed protein product, partial [Brassica oleracea]